MSEDKGMAGSPMGQTAETPQAPAPTATEGTPEAPAPPPPVMLPPSPVVASPPSPTPPPPPAVKTVNMAGPPKATPTPTEDGQGHLEAMRAELEEARKVRAQLQGMAEREASKARLSYLRRTGAVEALSDDNLMALAPVVDVETDEGRAEIEKWRAANAGLFITAQLSGKQETASMVEGLKSSKNGVFGPRLHARVAASALKD